MPYISKIRRGELSEYDFPENAGELNYSLTMLLIEYWKTHKQCYQTINDITGACEGAKLEFTRRITIPYENEKIKENSDVYPFIPHKGNNDVH